MNIKEQQIFHPITQKDIPLLKEIMACYTGLISDHAPANCLAWAAKHGTHVRFKEGVASVRFSMEGADRAFLYPSGSGDLQKEVEALIHEEQCLGMREIRFVCDQAEADILPCGFERELRRDLTDYIFDARAFVACKGRHYHRLRNFISASKRRYDARFESLGPDNGDAVLLLSQQSLEEKDETMHSDLEDELCAIKMLLENAKELELSGMVAYEGETPIAAIAATRPREDILDIHVRKQDPRYTGIALRITHLFVSQWLEKADIRWFNCEEDLGLPNLRRAKLCESPDLLADKYLCTLKL